MMRVVGWSTIALVALAGCASPGAPVAPSLKLPDFVADLSASRVGDQVKLKWTTPIHTADGLNLAGVTTAQICRETSAASPTTHLPAAPRGCTPVITMTVRPGATQAVDPLPPALTSGAPAILAYRILLHNGAGRTAGASAPAFTAAGAAPGNVTGLRIKTAKTGAVAEWQPQPGNTGEVVELDRITVNTPVLGAPTAEPLAATPKTQSLFAPPKEPVEIRLRVVGTTDPGGALDRNALTGHTYRYTAQRVRTVDIASHTVELKGPVSADVTIAMVDTFPPDIPTGLVTSPNSAGSTPAIDLSWEPGMEPGIAGYRVYRRQPGGDWTRISADLVPLPAYRDSTVTLGRRYAYRITAVDRAGNESDPGPETIETAPVQ